MRQGDWKESPTSPPKKREEKNQYVQKRNVRENEGRDLKGAMRHCGGAKERVQIETRVFVEASVTSKSV